MSMDSLLSIFAGLGFRLFMDSVSHSDYKLTSSLVGLWEGFVVHYYVSNKTPSLDPFIACAFRLFVDFIITRNSVKMVLIILWTGLGMALSEILAASWIDKPRGPTTVRSSRDTIRPTRRIVDSRVRFDGIEPSTTTTENAQTIVPRTSQPSTPRVSLRIHPPVTRTRYHSAKSEADSRPIPHEKASKSSGELFRPSQPNYPAMSTIPATTRITLPIADPLSGQNIAHTGNLTFKPRSIPGNQQTDVVNLPVHPESDLAMVTFPEDRDILHKSPNTEPVIIPAMELHVQPSANIDNGNDTTPTVRLIKLSRPAQSLPIVDDHHDTPPAVNNSDDRTPTMPVVELPLIASTASDNDIVLPYGEGDHTDPPALEIPIDNPTSSHFAIAQHGNTVSANALESYASNNAVNPLAKHPPVTLTSNQQSRSDTDGVTDQTREAFPTVNFASNDGPPLVSDTLEDEAHFESTSDVTALDNVPIGGSELTLTDQESVITAGSRTFVMERADTFREQAHTLERERDRLNEAIKISFREGRFREGLLLEGDFQETEQRCRRLHEKAARRYFHAHNLILPPRTIDVHRLRVVEALQETNRAFRKTLLANGTQLRVIVGRGRHSRGKVPVLKLKIIEDMKRRKIPHRLDPSNNGVLIIGLSESSLI